MAMSAGARAAANGVPITTCPFGVCQGLEDEFHEDILISSWVLGWGEEVIRAGVQDCFDVGIEFSDMTQEGEQPALLFLMPSNRLRAALVDGFTQGVIIGDFNGVLQ